MQRNQNSIGFHTRDDSARNYLRVNVTNEYYYRNHRSLPQRYRLSNPDESGWKPDRYQSRILLVELDLGNRKEMEVRQARLGSRYNYETAWAALSRVNLLADGSFTQLSPEFVELMGKALDIKCPATLTNSVKDNPACRWVDSRGTIAFLGGRHTAEIESGGRYKTLDSVLGGIAKISVRRAIQLRRKDRYFLYRQPIRYLVPAIGEVQEGYWIGLATTETMTSYYKRMGTGDLARILSLTCDPSQSSSIAGSMENIGHPIHRHMKVLPDTLKKLSERQWKHWASKEKEEWHVEAPKTLLSHINLEMALNGTPLGIIVRKLQADLKTQREEHQDLEAKRTQLLHRKVLLTEDLNQQLLKIQTIQSRINQINDWLPATESRIITVEPKLQRQTARLRKIKQIAERKQMELNARKSDYRTKLAARKIPDYGEALKRSGIDIIDLTYANRVTGVEMRASNDPQIATNPEWQLIAAHLKSTRPLAIQFGLPETEARASGPHEIKIKSTLRNDNILAEIRSLYPWSVVGVHNGRVKPYPHVEGTAFVADDPRSYWIAMNRWQYLCLGELTDSAYKAFRNNNPRQLALATLSFLQSVNPEDTWGCSYKSFPYYRNVISEAQSPQQTPPVEKLQNRYFIDFDKKKFIHCEWNNIESAGSYGNLIGDSANFIESTRSPINRAHIDLILEKAKEKKSWALNGYNWTLVQLIRPVSLTNLPQERTWSPSTTYSAITSGYNSVASPENPSIR